MENERKLLIEFIGYLQIPKSTIMEAKSNTNNNIIIEGKIQAAEQKNKNGRIYPKSILMREYKRFLEKIKNKDNGGELDHPDSPIVNLRNISHKIIELWWKGNDLYGKVELIDTPNGNIAKKLVASDLRLGISSRGLGSVKRQNGCDIVQENFELLTWDLVSTPSTHGAYLDLKESDNKESIIEHKTTIDKINIIINNIIELNNYIKE